MSRDQFEFSIVAVIAALVLALVSGLVYNVMLTGDSIRACARSCNWKMSVYTRKNEIPICICEGVQIPKSDDAGEM